MKRLLVFAFQSKKHQYKFANILKGLE